MDCIKIICLYLKGYISDEQFENIFYDYINNFQKILEEDMYLNILSTNFGLKEKKISLVTKLHNYVLANYRRLYEEINDSYVERMIASNKTDIIVEILKKKYEKKKEISVDCSMINTKMELIYAMKAALQYPEFCGSNWDAFEDLIYDVIFPERLIFNSWHEIEKKLPEDAAILKEILSRNNNDRCVIIYT